MSIYLSNLIDLNNVAPQTTDRIKELILNLAFEGSLTGDYSKSDWDMGKTLKDFGKMIRGITYAKSDSKKDPVGDHVPLLSAVNIQREINYSNMTFVPSKLVKSEQLLQDKDILICMSSGSKKLVGKAAMIYKPLHASFGAFCAVYRPTNQIDADYIALFFQSPMYRVKISESSRGIGINNLRISDIESIKIPFPPLEKQKAIVARVLELLALLGELQKKINDRESIIRSAQSSSIEAISTAQTQEEFDTAWNRIQQNWDVIAGTSEAIESLKTLILDLAIRGDLVTVNQPNMVKTIDWTSSELKLNESKLWHLPTLRDEKKQGWNRIPLAKIGSWGSGGTPTSSRKDYYQNGTIPWAVIGDLNNGIMTKTEVSITEKALAESSSKLLPKGAILIAMYGASIGKTAITGIDCCTNQAIAHCIVDSKLVSKDYFFIVAKSLKRHLIKEGKGAAQPNISQSVLKHLIIDLPPLEEQAHIVARVEELMQMCDRLNLLLNESEVIAEKFSRSVVSTLA